MSGVPPKASPVLRRATADDVPVIAAIEQLAFAHEAERFSSRKIRYLIASPRSAVLVAESSGRVVGWAAGFVLTRSPERWGRIYAVAVHPEARGYKVGSLLMRELMAELQLRGASRFVLEVRPDNAAAIRLYERLGFTRCVLLPNYYAPGLDARRMVCD